MQTERGGEGLSRTLWESGGSPFKTAAFNRSATTPGGYKLFPGNNHDKRSGRMGWANAYGSSSFNR